MAASIAIAASKRLPTVFVNHGGGPLPLLGDPGHAPLTKYLKGFSATLRKPKALLIVSAHWEESGVTVSNGEQPKMIYDYYGFPPESYQFKYTAPGSPPLAQQVTSLLQGAGIKARQQERGYDHGTFVPLMLMYPKADIPVVQVSLHRSLDPEVHIRIGQALSPLRDEGVLIIGSGMSYHNMSALRARLLRGGSEAVATGPLDGQEFADYLTQACESEPQTRNTMLSSWKRAPGGVEAHPREEHLLPLMVAAGAAGEDKGKVVYAQGFAGYAVVGFMFGESSPQGRSEL